MGFLSDIIGKISGSPTGGPQSGLQSEIIGLLTHAQTGGLQGLFDTFKAKGLGDQFSSWIGTGQNQSVSPEQITHTLGSEKISQIAQKLGLGQQEAAHGISSILPDIIDKLTPHGTIPQGDALNEGLDSLKKLLSKN
jgi:uncharacterized protein YidB (DUF937 family)